VNAIVPAKLGEVAKAIYLKQESQLTMANALSVVFWERFFDLNALLVCGMLGLAVIGQNVAVVPLLCIVSGIWAFLFFHAKYPKLARHLLRLVPVEKLRILATEILGTLGNRFNPNFLAILAAYTITVWGVYLLTYFLVLKWVCGLSLTMGQVFAVFTAGALGMTIPASPGSLGVFEMAIVASLSWFGVNKEQALGAAVILHSIQLLPAILWGLVLISKSGLNLSAFKKLDRWRAP
jgi:hypothetical protein